MFEEGIKNIKCYPTKTIQQDTIFISIHIKMSAEIFAKIFIFMDEQYKYQVLKIIIGVSSKVLYVNVFLAIISFMVDFLGCSSLFLFYYK
jgi:hypothetical protein